MPTIIDLHPFYHVTSFHTSIHSFSSSSSSSSSSYSSASGYAGSLTGRKLCLPRIQITAEAPGFSLSAIHESASVIICADSDTKSRYNKQNKHQIRAANVDDGREALAESDIVIVGAGIIGLAIANRLLNDTKFSVTVVDAKQPCAGASGAGQGYIWLGHMQPEDLGWPLVYRSKQLWEDLVSDLRASGVDPLRVIGWKNTGSIVVADTHDLALKLKKRVEVLQNEGIRVEYLDAALVRKLEPAISIEEFGSGAFTPEDTQIDARLATLFLQERSRSCFGRRYSELFHNEVTDLIISSSDNHISGVETSQGKVYCKEALVVAAGAWTASIMQNLAEKHDLPVVPSIKPRKGHLLVLEQIPDLHLQHGLMEAGYKEHAEISDLALDDFGIAMTATADAKESLLLGSSRQFSGFDANPEEEVIEHILHRAAKFLPPLRRFSISELRKRTTVRVGFRPYISDENPVIGAVPDVPGLFLASGHEGSGLTMAPATAEIISRMISGESMPLNTTPYLPSGRLLRLQN